MRLIDADELLKYIPTEEMCSRFAVTNAPTVESQRWIPITERLPGAYNIVLVTLINGDVTIGRYDTDTHQWSVYSGNWWNARGNDILAWMPLPIPYIV